MYEVKKRTIVIIASVLKPVDDTRMFEKIGLSLANTKQYQLHIIGFDSTSTPLHPTIVFHPLRAFKRLSIQRLLTPFKILLKALSLKPTLFIITTHELLIIAGIVKLLTGCKIIYDVRENYFQNILGTTAFPLIIRNIVAGYVRVKEVLTSIFVDHFFLAEKGYERELIFPGLRTTILENKSKKSLSPHCALKKNNERITLLFSGTLAEITGVFTAIDIAVSLHRIDYRINLVIIGYCSQPEIRIRLKNAVRPHSFIHLIGGDSLVPHNKIMEQIMLADFGIISYTINRSTINSIPTKLYEYLSAKLPILLINHQPWVDICRPYNAAVVFEHPVNFTTLHYSMIHHQFYTLDPENVYWEAEEVKLLHIVNVLLNPQQT
jgi:glycosyltransferase involved in cell wall biosynthesis